MIRVVSWLCVHVASVSLDMFLINSGNVFASIVGGLAWVLEVFPDVASGIAWVLGVCPSIASGISWKIRCKPGNNKSRLGVNLRTIRARHL